MEAIANSGHEGRIEIGLDVAASEFYDKETNSYNLSHKLGTKDRVLNAQALSDLYANLVAKYPIKSIEDPFD